MRLPVIKGLIRRRLLVNFRVDRDVMSRFLPLPFRPKLHQGHAVAGICLIRLEAIRPKGIPAFLGLTSENAAHRIAVEWNEADGSLREGVYIPRRDTGSRLNALTGGRLFPGEQNLADFDVTDDGRRIDMDIRSRDGVVKVRLKAEESDEFPASSCFASRAESSAFFESGSVGYSVTSDRSRLDGMQLKTKRWDVRPLAVAEAASSFFSDTSVFPAGSVTFDHALIMRDIPHEWHQVRDMTIRHGESGSGAECS